MNPFKLKRQWKVTYQLGPDGVRHELRLSRAVVPILAVLMLSLIILSALYLVNLQNWMQTGKTMTKLQQENTQLRQKLEYYSGVIDTIYQKLDTLQLIDKKSVPTEKLYPYNSNDRSESLSENTFVYDTYLDARVNAMEQQICQISDCLNRKSSLTLALAPVMQDGKPIQDSGPSIYPTFGRWSDGWGTRMHPFYKRLMFHYGIDFANKIGTPIYATSDGEIITTVYDQEYGKVIKIRHNNGYETRYGHLHSFLVVIGDRVRKGQIIGLMGNTGMSTGPHLHYEVILGGNKVNPSKYLNRIDDVIYYASQ